MYSNNRGFSFVDILLKVVFFVIFILVLVLLFPQVKDLNPFYSGIFRENISYMQDAAEGYFNQTENLPAEIGETKKLTLKQMIEQNLIIPFVDKDNNSCNLYSSYAEITKLKEGYNLKINLVCNDESNYIEKTIGCNNYCDGVNCKNLKDACSNCDKEETPVEKKCYDEKNVIYYQFKKSETKLSTSYYCEEGYSLRDKKCYREKTDNRTPATPIYDPDKTYVTNAIVTPGETYKEYTSERITTYQTVKTPIVTKELLSTIRTAISGGTYQEPYSCPQTTYQNQPCLKSTTTRQCTTTNKTESYKCNCTSVYRNGSYQEVCSTCTRTVPVQTCNDVPSTYWGTCTVPVTTTGICYRTVTAPGTIAYSCPTGTDSTTGSGSSLKCYKNVTTYKEEKIKKISCPADVDGSEGSGDNLKCYYIKKKPDTYSCSNPKATRQGNKCYLTVPGGFKGYTCPTDKNYKLDGNYCYYTTIDETDAKFKTSTTTNWLYEWSTNPVMSGWERTGVTKTSKTSVVVPCK